MKKTFIECGAVLCGILFLTTGTVSAQDIIVFNNKTADEIEAKVVEVSSNEVKYKKWNYQDGPTFSVSTDEIFVIKYRNGEKQTFLEQKEAEAAPAASQNSSVSYNAAAPHTYGQTSDTGQQIQPSAGSAGPAYFYSFAKPKENRWGDFEPHVEGGIYFGYALGLGVFALDAIECMELRIGYRFNPYFFLGGSASNLMFYDYPKLYEDMPDTNGFVPILADARAYLPLGEKVSLFGDFGLGVNVGYGVCSTDFTYQVGPGIEIGSFSISAIYRHYGENAGAMSFKVGWTF